MADTATRPTVHHDAYLQAQHEITKALHQQDPDEEPPQDLYKRRKQMETKLFSHLLPAPVVAKRRHTGAKLKCPTASPNR